jgi:hypothetical protein
MIRKSPLALLFQPTVGALSKRGLLFLPFAKGGQEGFYKLWMKIDPHDSMNIEKLFR